MVYQLYNLTAEEIGIVNDGTNFWLQLNFSI
jgi:hypothetical protein